MDDAPTRMMKQMKELEAQQKVLQAHLAEAEEPPPLLHPNMAHHYRAQVEDLYTALQEDSEARRMEATDVLRSLVKEIVLTPDPDSGELLIEVRGDLAGILTIALERKKPADVAGGVQVEMAAGTCSNQKLRTQKSRTDGAAGARDTGSQFEMVAGAGFEPAAFRL